MSYRALRNIAIATPGGGHRIVLQGNALCAEWLSAAGLERLLARKYIEAVAEVATPVVWTGVATGLTAIRGIGKERAKLLIEFGLGTLAALAQATPEQLELLQAHGITAKQSADWQKQAAVLLSGTLTSGGTCERCSTKKVARRHSAG